MSDLMFILTAVERDEGIRFEFDEETGRTLSRIDKARLAFPDDGEFGALLAKRPPDGVELEARDLDGPPPCVGPGDELAKRRAQRRAA